MKTLIIKSLLTSLCQREGIYPSLAKRGEGRFFNNNALLMNSFVNIQSRTINLFSYEEESAEKILMEGGDNNIQ